MPVDVCVCVCVCVFVFVCVFAHTVHCCVCSNPSLKCQTSPHSWLVKSIRGPEVCLPPSFTLRTFQLKVDISGIFSLGGITSNSVTVKLSLT